MSNPAFIPIIPNNYSSSPLASANRRQGMSGNTPEFKQALEQFTSQMESSMTNAILDGGSSSKQSTDIFSQAMNMNVLSTLSKLVHQQGEYTPSHTAQTSSPVETGSGDTTTQPISVDQAVENLEEKIIAAHTPGYSSQTAQEPLGILSEIFESGQQIDAVGYDGHGGTSYGIFQISSRQGTMGEFIDFLQEQAPEMGTRLKNAGAANTGSTQGTMPSEWRAIATENPQQFKTLQRRFIAETHYLPALKNVLEATGIEKEMFATPLKEVLFSTAVQHGPTGAAKIFERAMQHMGDNGPQDVASQLLEQVYAIRKTQFTHSTDQVQSAVQNRLDQEKTLAQNLMATLSA